MPFDTGVRERRPLGLGGLICPFGSAGVSGTEQGGVMLCSGRPASLLWYAAGLYSRTHQEAGSLAARRQQAFERQQSLAALIINNTSPPAPPNSTARRRAGTALRETFPEPLTCYKTICPELPCDETTGRK